MKITLEQVEELRRRIDCDYQTAEKALRKNRGRMNDAILYLKKKRDSKSKKVYKELKDIFSKIFNYNLVIIRNNKIFINFPVIIILLIVMILNISLPVILIVILIAILAECSFEIVNKNEKEEDIYNEYVNEKSEDPKRNDNNNNEVNNFDEANIKENTKDNELIDIVRNVSQKVNKQNEQIIDDDKKVIENKQNINEKIKKKEITEKANVITNEEGYNEIIID